MMYVLVFVFEHLFWVEQIDVHADWHKPECSDYVLKNKQYTEAHLCKCLCSVPHMCKLFVFSAALVQTVCGQYHTCAIYLRSGW